MNILPKKRWHVRTRENIIRVRRDEARVAAEEKERDRQTQLAEGEARNAALKKKSLLRSGQTIPIHEEPQRHINLFEDLERGAVVSNATNAECEKEKKEEREKYEKQIGYLTYLGQDTVEATGCVSWYNKVPDRGPSGSDSKKKNLLGDPLHDIKRYLDLEKIRCNSKKGRHENRDDKRKYTESEKNEIRRVHKKSKNKMGKEKGRTTKSSSSSRSGCDTSSECADSKTMSTRSANKLEQLRAQRLKREQEEQKRSEALLARLRGEPDLNATKFDDVPAITQRYHSQFNPHLARQNKL